MHRRDPETRERKKSTESASTKQKLVALFAALIMITSIMIGLAQFLSG